MKTKTAQIHIELMWGNPLAVVVGIYYRGHILIGFEGHKAETPHLVGMAYTWANNQGFTHMNVELNSVDLKKL
jgi:hypothetical protein